jgi:hypothetical protein
VIHEHASDAISISESEASIEHTDSRSVGDVKGILRLGILGALAASLCCLTPVVLVLITAGLTAIFGPELFGKASQGEITQGIHEFTDLWYDDHKWAFRGAGLLLILAGLIVYFRRRGICTLDSAKRHRDRILNATALAVLLAAGIYWVWTYIVLHYGGIWIGLPW